MRELLIDGVTGITFGSLFALIGSGFVVVHRVTRRQLRAGFMFALSRRCGASLLRGDPHGLAEAATVLVCGVVACRVGWVVMAGGTTAISRS